MNRKQAAKQLESYLPMLYAFVLSRLYDKTEAEDLTNDIICAVLRSAPNLREDEAFHSFMWRVAENTLKKYYRDKKQPAEEYTDGIGVYWTTPEEEYLRSEERHLLRRELSLLSEQHRTATVAYYIHGKSCSAIAQEMGISVEMVKYHLFTSRKQLKEGMNMTRIYGEKSYDPGVFRINFWGSRNIFWKLFQRRLPGNILLAAYEQPLTLRELATELGVSAPYLEDELHILLEHDLISQIGHKYQTNIIIMTLAYEQTLRKKYTSLYLTSAQHLAKELDRLLPQLHTLDFVGNDYDDNRLRWLFANQALWLAATVSNSVGNERFGAYPELYNGDQGFVFGHDNDYELQYFNGIYGYCENRGETAYYSIHNYRIFEKCQSWQPGHWDEASEVLCDAILSKPADEHNKELVRQIEEGYVYMEDGHLVANFPVFTATAWEELHRLLKPLAETIGAKYIEGCEMAGKLLKDSVPKRLKDRCEHLAFICHQLDGMGWIAEYLVGTGYLTIPEKKTNLCMVGVIK